MLITAYLYLILRCYAQGFFVDDISSELSTQMTKDGKNQYQLLQERGTLPRYGECWTSAVEYIHEGCRYLTEDIQSDIALRITNCFLQMSGHETYNCDTDKKPNLRGICISSMTDRAFNVYTEFYTHAQNICWFLRGQVWQEKINENTRQVGEQLKDSVARQHLLLQRQKESLLIQEQILSYGKNLERVLNQSRIQTQDILQEIRESTVQHRQLLSLATSSLSGLQSWLIGEISWFDSLVFYTGAAVIVAVLTSVSRTSQARLPVLFTLSLNVVVERAISGRLSAEVEHSEIHVVQENLYRYIWGCRYFAVGVCAFIVGAKAYFYQDFAVVNNRLLLKIHEENSEIRDELSRIRCQKFSDQHFKDGTPNKLGLNTETGRNSTTGKIFGLRGSTEPDIIIPSVSNRSVNSETGRNSTTREFSCIRHSVDPEILKLNFNNCCNKSPVTLNGRSGSTEEEINPELTAKVNLGPKSTWSFPSLVQTKIPGLKSWCRTICTDSNSGERFCESADREIPKSSSDFRTETHKPGLRSWYRTTSSGSNFGERFSESAEREIPKNGSDKTDTNSNFGARKSPMLQQLEENAVLNNSILNRVNTSGEIRPSYSRLVNGRSSVSSSRESLNFSAENSVSNYVHSSTSDALNLSTSVMHRYNLRRRQETPVPNI